MAVSGDDLAIMERAQQLWEKAGYPEGRDLEFWLEAERQIKEERIRVGRPLPSPSSRNPSAGPRGFSS